MKFATAALLLSTTAVYGFAPAQRNAFASSSLFAAEAATEAKVSVQN